MKTNVNARQSGENARAQSCDRQLIAEALGFRDLGLLDEAEASLRRAIETGGDDADRARAELAHLLLAQRHFDESASLGMDLIRRGVMTEDIVINAMLALHFLGRITEARETLKLVEKCGGSLERESYQQACFASRLGEFPEALGWLLKEFRRSRDYYIHCFEDIDLVPLWEWLRNHLPTLAEAHDIMETPLDHVRGAGHQALEDVRYSAGDLDELSPTARGLLRYDFQNGRYQMPPLCAVRDRKATQILMRSRRERIASVDEALGGLAERALSTVLDAQPRYAAEHASWRNHLGARYHILWALPLRPSLMQNFLDEPALEMMRPLLKEYAFASEHDPDFGARINAVADCVENDPDKAWRLLDQTPKNLRETNLYQLRLAAVFQADNDYERALSIWESLRERWPDDAIGYANGIDALIGLGRHTEAREILALAPRCYRRFRIYYRQSAVLNGTMAPANQSIKPFRGRPELGGHILPVSCPAVRFCCPD